MIPAYLATFDWYAPHEAWCREQYGFCRHQPPDGTVAKRACLTGADLTWADLTGAYLSRAYLTWADLTGAYLSRAYLSRADLTGAYLSRACLTGADLTWADLTGAYLSRADLTWADLSGACLTGADLTGADLTGARGIVSAGPVGAEPRMVYAVKHAACVMVQAGCSWATAEATKEAIRERYADGTGREHLRADYLAAIDSMVAALEAA